jgi:hypothetical protein
LEAIYFHNNAVNGDSVGLRAFFCSWAEINEQCVDVIAVRLEPLLLAQL